jgi:hypothetical protein
MPAIATNRHEYASPSRGWTLCFAALAVGAAGALMLMGVNLNMLYAIVAVLGIMAAIIVVMNPMFGILCLLGTLTLGLHGSWLKTVAYCQQPARPDPAGDADGPRVPDA